MGIVVDKRRLLPKKCRLCRGNGKRNGMWYDFFYPESENVHEIDKKYIF